MDFPYDEDLSENPFYKILRLNFHEIFHKASLEGCVICIPRLGTLSNSIQLDDMLSHILIPNEELPESHFRSLNGQNIIIFSKQLSFENGQTIKVLFEETYYTKDLSRYRMVCVDRPIGVESAGSSKNLHLATLNDCNEYLSRFSKSISLLLDTILEEYNPSFQSNLMTLRSDWVRLFNTCLKVIQDAEIVLENNYLLVNRLKLALETYMHDRLYIKLFRVLSFLSGPEDCILNKRIRNYNTVEQPDLVLSTINSTNMKLDVFTTVLDKVNCLRETFSKLACEDDQPLTADTLISRLVELIVSSNVTTWRAQLMYLKYFNLSMTSTVGDATEFLVTSLEAALEHLIKSTNQCLLPIIFDELQQTSTINKLFDHITHGNLGSTREILETSSTTLDYLREINLCHPLCDCSQCSVRIRNFKKFSKPDFDSCDNFGRTLLHIASAHNQVSIAEYLMEIGHLDPSKVDLNGQTPLHYAGRYGHDQIVSVILKTKKNLLKLDNKLNTALHIAASYGHGNCVQVMLLEQELDINKLLNEDGDTPLHLASRYGFLDIVTILINQTNANPNCINKQNLTSFDVAANPAVAIILGNKHRLIPKPIKETIQNRLRSLVEKFLQAATHGDINLLQFYHKQMDTLDATAAMALHISCLNGYSDIINYLLLNNIDVNIKNDNQKTALMLVSENLNRSNIARLLLATQRCNLLMRDDNGNTALHLACHRGNITVVKELLQYAHDNLLLNEISRACNNVGKTPLDVSYNNGGVALIQLVQRFVNFTKCKTCN